MRTTKLSDFVILKVKDDNVFRAVSIESCCSQIVADCSAKGRKYGKLQQNAETRKSFKFKEISPKRYQ